MSDVSLLDPSRARFYQGVGYAVAVVATGLVVAGVTYGGGWPFVYVPAALMALGGVALARTGRALAGLAGEDTPDEGASGEGASHRARRSLAVAAGCMGFALVLLGGDTMVAHLRGPFDAATFVMSGLVPFVGGLAFVAYARRVHPLAGAG